MICVYGIVPARVVRVRTRGGAGETLHALRVGRVAAIAGSRRGRVRQTPRTLTAYHATVERLAREVPALIPSRFGSTFTDADELRLVLGARSEAFLRVLALVRNRWQVTVRFALEADELVSEVPLDKQSGASYLRSLAERAKVLTRVPRIAAARLAVDHLVRGERIEARGRIVTIYHLIPRRRIDAYRRAMSLAVPTARVTGPFAPYAFTDASS